MVTPSADLPTSRLTWNQTHRLILSRYPPIDLFDDLADPRDWEALARAEARTNPRVYDQIGDLSLVPAERRIAGPGASWVMAAFTHVSPDRTSRFSDGSYGVYYAGKVLETALREHTFHMARFYAETNEAPGWLSDVRQLIGKVDCMLTDIRGSGTEGRTMRAARYAHLLDPDITRYGAAQNFARQERARGSDGIVYPRLRLEKCWKVFF